MGHWKGIGTEKACTEHSLDEGPARNAAMGTRRKDRPVEMMMKRDSPDSGKALA